MQKADDGIRTKFGTVVLAVAIASATGSACAMNSPPANPPVCSVDGGDKLPASSGGPGALCAAIERTAGNAFSVRVRVLSPSMLAAVVTTADGRTLPEQRLAVSDSTLSKGSFERFAQTLASEVARTSPR